MAITTAYPLNISSPAQLTRENYNNVGASAFILGEISRAFRGSTELEIWDSASGGTRLVEDTDYTLGGINAFYTSAASLNIYTTVTIDNVTYQTGDIFITYKTIGSFTSAPFYNATIPAGIISTYAGSSAPTGYLDCDGTAISRTIYADLFTNIGTTWGVGDGSTTFNVPDLRGMFLRGTGSHGTLNMANGNDFAGPSVGSSENDQIQRFDMADTTDNSHMLGTDDTRGATGAVDGNMRFTAGGGIDGVAGFDLISDGINGTPRTGDESRPVNFGITYIIKT